VADGARHVSDGRADVGFDSETVFREHQAALLRHLLYLTGDRALAEDLAQETFGRLVSAERSQAVRNPRAWLMATGSNLAYNHFRGEGRRVEREARYADSSGSAESDPDAVVDVRRCLGQLEPRERAVLMLRHSGFTYAEIGEATELAPTSVGTVLARAHRRFRDIYENGADHQSGVAPRPTSVTRK
jgi:RNA polymerase sigma factor (sigma-70 family)